MHSPATLLILTQHVPLTHPPASHQQSLQHPSSIPPPSHQHPHHATPPPERLCAVAHLHRHRRIRLHHHRHLDLHRPWLLAPRRGAPAHQADSPPNGLRSEDCKSCTFFAPTNAAFAKWDAENPSRKDRRNTLLYHILGESVFSHDLKDAMLLETLLVRFGYLGDDGEGQLVAVSKPSWRPGKRGHLLVGDAELLQKDWKAENGVVHVVDRLMIQPGDIVDTLQKHEELSALYNIIRNAGLDDFLRQHRPFTLFAPTGDALKKLSPIQVRYLQHEQGLKDLETTVQHHIHTGTLYRQDIQPGSSSVSTVEGQELMVSLDDKLMVDNAMVERTDILAANGVIHTVSRPLLPSALVWTAAKYLIGGK